MEDSSRFTAHRILSLFVFLASTNAIGQIVVGWENPPRTIDPRYTTDAYSHYLSDLINCSLINFDENGATIGELANSWNWKNAQTLEVEIKSGVKFSDGSTLSAADVKATYEFFKLEKLKKPSPLSGAFKKISEITIKSPKKIIFSFNEPDTSFVPNLMIGILPKKIAKKEMLTSPKDLVGCGPYRLKSMNVSGLKLIPNPNFSLAKKPNNKGIEIKIVKDELTRFSKLKKGELDLVQDRISRDKIKNIAKNHPKLKIIRRPGLNTTYLGFNMRDKVVSKAKVRRAIAHAINRQKIIDYIFHGMATQAKTLLTPNDPYLNPNLETVKFDPKKARTLLDEAGFKDPDGDNGPKSRFSLTYKTTTNITRINIAQAIASQLKKVGIDVKVQSLEWGKFKEDVEKGQVQMWSLSWVGFKDPDIYRYAFATESFPPNGGNRGWYSNKELDKLLAEAKTAIDTKQRVELYHKVQSIIDKEMPYVFLWHEESFAVMQNQIEGFKLYADGRMSALRTTSK